MSRRRIFQPTLAAALAAVVTLALLTSSCLEELPPVGSLSDIGVVEGRITEAGVPVSAEIHFRSPSDAPVAAEVTVQADADGRYHAELPLGHYAYFLRLDGQTAPRDSETDTVQVGRAVRRLDLVRSRAQVTIWIPSALECGSANLQIATVLRYYHGQPDWMDASDESPIEDERAVFDLRLVPPASYRMFLDCNGGPYDVIVPVPGTVDTPDSLRVRSNAVAHHEFDFRPSYASISGHVSGSPRMIPGNVDIGAWDTQQHRVAWTYAQADGSYRLEFLNAKPVRVNARYGDINQWYGGADFARAAVIDARSGANAEGVDITGGGLRVGFEGPGTRIANAADLVLVDPDGQEFEVSNYSQNPLVIDNLRAGQWRLYTPGGCAGEPWQPQWWENAADLAHATPLNIVAGQLLDLTVTLAPGGSVSGTLVRRAGTGLWLLHISPCDLAGRPLCAPPATSTNEGFELVGIPDGEYLLAIYLTPTPWWYPGTWERAEADTVRVVDGGDVTGLSWTLPFPYKGAAP